MTCRLWWVRPDNLPADPASLALLSDAEQRQRERYISPAKRHEYLATRVMVRSVLGATLGLAPEALEFTCNEWGRPALVQTRPSGPVHFNVSHTDGLVVCLVSTEHEVGVDTELFSRAGRVLELAPRVFAPRELADLATLAGDDQAERALRLWTLKESYIKARGMGLALPLDGFAFDFADAQPRLTVEPALQDDGGRWQFHTVHLGAHCVSTALALPVAHPGAATASDLIDQVEFRREP